jgi:hypothetical protein
VVVAGADAVPGVDAEGVGAMNSLDALSNSFLAKPIDRASSGSFCGPQRKMITTTAMTTIHSYPISANAFSHQKVLHLADIKMVNIQYH